MNRYAWLATIVLVTILGRRWSNKDGGGHSSPNRAYPNQAKPDAAPGKLAQPLVILPWVEVNALASRTINHAVEGLLIWQKVTDPAIVSTGPGCAALYPGLRRRVP